MAEKPVKLKPWMERILERARKRGEPEWRIEEAKRWFEKHIRKEPPPSAPRIIARKRGKLSCDSEKMPDDSIIVHCIREGFYEAIRMPDGTIKENVTPPSWWFQIPKDSVKCAIALKNKLKECRVKDTTAMDVAITALCHPDLVTPSIVQALNPERKLSTISRIASALADADVLERVQMPVYAPKEYPTKGPPRIARFTDTTNVGEPIRRMNDKLRDKLLKCETRLEEIPDEEWKEMPAWVKAQYPDKKWPVKVCRRPEELTCTDLAEISAEISRRLAEIAKS